MARGGKRIGAGRKHGSKTKAGRELREIAQEYTEEAIERLAKIMRESESDTASATAAIHILDRGHGKPSQIIAGDKENPIRLIVEAAGAALDGKLARLVTARTPDAAKPADAG